MSSGSIRIIQLPEKSSVNTDDYMAVDSSANGTKKVKFTDLLDDNLSAQNKAADAQATGEAINDVSTRTSEAINNVSARVDNMINTQQNASVTTLWTGTLKNKNQSVTLSKSIANFDFVDVYCGGVESTFVRKPVANSITFHLQQQNMSDDASVQGLRWWESGLTISGTTATITKCVQCYWDDFSQVPVVSQSTDGIEVIRIDGVKIGHVEDDEVVDARVGADGTTYPTLGDAIRGQVTDLKSDLDTFLGLKYNTAWVRGQWHQGSLLIGSAYNKKRATANIITLDRDIIINMSDFSEYKYGIQYFNSDGTFISDSGWLVGELKVNSGQRIAITLAYTNESAHEVVDNVKNDLWLACNIASANSIPALNRIADALTAHTKNLLTDTNPTKRTSTNAITVLDLGADTTFANGVTFSFKANNAVTTSLTRAIVDLKKADGTHQYLTYNSTADANGKKFTLEAQTGRFYSTQPNYKASITFRYVDIYYNDTISSGTLTDFMLVDGVVNDYYADSLTGIDYVARGEAEKANSMLSPYPAYWNTAVQTAVRSVLDNRLEIASGDEFVFITDQHWSANAQKSSMLIDYLVHRLSLNLVVSGGDLIQGHNATLDGAVDEIVNYYDSFKVRHRILSLIGNHDTNTNNNSDTTTHIPLIGLYNLMLKSEESWIDTKNSPYVNVYDNDSQKIRYIQFYYTVDSGYVQDVATALVSTMQSTPSDWTIVLLSHAYWNGDNPTTTGTQYANLILDTMDDIDATVAMWLVGHVHADKDTTLTSNGNKDLLIVSTNTDCYKQTVHQYDMLVGTNTEQCFDVVQIDTTMKKIYMTRVGAGLDREFSY